MTNHEMTEWLINNHREVLNYLKQEFDGDIKEYYEPAVVANMELFYYCRLRIEYVDGDSHMAEMVTEKKEEGVAILRLRIHKSNLPQGF